MYEFQNYINQLLSDLVNDVTGSTGSFIGAAKLIAGFGALIAVYMVYKKSVTDGEPINMNEIYRIGALFLGIMFYGTFISLINLPLNLIENSIKSVAVSDTAETDSFFNSYKFGAQSQTTVGANEQYDKQLMDDINSSKNDVGVTDMFESVVAMVVDPASSLMTSFQNYITEALFNFIHFLGVIAMIILNIVRSFFLIVLTYFGIFVLAISVFPGLQGSFFQWLQKYINVYLWSAIAWIFQGLISKLFQYYKPTEISGDMFSSGSTFADQTQMVVVGIVGIASIIGFALVPTISGWFINAATSSVGSKLKQKGGEMMKSAKAVGKVASAKATGGASLMK